MRPKNSSYQNNKCSYYLENIKKINFILEEKTYNSLFYYSDQFSPYFSDHLARFFTYKCWDLKPFFVPKLKE